MESYTLLLACFIKHRKWLQTAKSLRSGSSKEQACPVNPRDPAAHHCRAPLAGCSEAWSQRRIDVVLLRAVHVLSVWWSAGTMHAYMAAPVFLLPSDVYLGWDSACGGALVLPQETPADVLAFFLSRSKDSSSSQLFF